ncbi:EamA family transporter [Lewinella sp. 4G2]|uniref:EamA family transporter n=1 Tax=Lewinella sp. 4G2 TaxID=1803372 RepID=UPI0007B4F27E|nr:EamA family transporter [Lewinella sp. 4G2]OAV44328.1 hypothetical protein A3850_007400 [Lewinella sp. 4G2]
MQKEKWLIVAAFFTTYFVWGSTYLANYWAIETLPVFGMGGARFLTAGVLLWILSLFFGDRGTPTLRQFLNCGLIGILFLTMGTGTVVWAQQWVPTSTTALIIAFEPLLVMLIMWLVFTERPGPKAFIGAAVSIGGMFLLINQPATLTGDGAYKGILGILFGMGCWAFGMTLTPKLDMGKNKFRATSMQMLVGGAVLLAFSFAANDWDGFAVEQVSLKSALAWVFLVLFGAILAFSAFNFLLSRVSPDKAATNTYVNPVVAVVLGALLNGEVVTKQTILAGVVMLAGVYFIQTATGKAEVPDPSSAE